MAKKKVSKKKEEPKNVQRPPAEVLYQEELKRLAEEDGDAPRPPGWKLSPRSVLDFVLGSTKRNLTPKFVGRRSFVECCIVAVASERGLMLIGEPGTAKSYLSELIAAAVSGDSTLTVQGSAGTTEDQIRYSWNYAQLLAEGPTPAALVEGPLHRGMREGKVVRFEELTRCPIEVQDTLLSVLSDRVLLVPELEGEGRTVFSREGFNVIATSNTRDKGVNEMSAALKRRFIFETVHPIGSLDRELELVQRETNRHFARLNVPVTLPPDKTELLVTTFHELRNGKTGEGKALEPLSSVMSTAEAVAVGCAAGLHAYYYSSGQVQSEHLITNMLGTVIKDSDDDLKRLRHYFEHIVGNRKGAAWRDYYAARRALDYA